MGAEQSSLDSPGSLQRFPQRSGKQKSGIVTVHRGTSGNAEESGVDVDLEQLQQIPVFFPLIKSSVLGGPSSSRETSNDLVCRLEPRLIASVAQRFQRHLAAGTQVLFSEQANLTTRIREVCEK